MTIRRRPGRRGVGLACLLTLLSWPLCAEGGPRVLSLDQCADQYVLALAPRQDIVGLSKRATKADSYFATRAAGAPQRRATLEDALAARPQVVVRYWGGDGRLLAALARYGVKTVAIHDATDFAGVRVNVRRVAAALDRREAGEAINARMNTTLAASAGAWRGRAALYLTSGGFTAGPGTLIDAMMRAAGLANFAGRPGYHYVSLEGLVVRPPAVLIEGFFDAAIDAFEHWSEMRNPLVAGIASRARTVALPASILACPAWFAADGAKDIADQRTAARRD